MVIAKVLMLQGGVPPYWEEAKLELMKRDRIMNKLIPQFGDLHLRGHHDPFTTLARSIVGQQVTAKVADVAWKKLLALSPKCTAQIIKAGPEQLAACGLSKRKTEYILDLADHFKKARPAQWDQMDDEAVIAELTQIRGIGRWTAEMFLIFNLLPTERFTAGRPRSDPGHQPELLLRRTGLAQRCARGFGQLGTLPHGRHMVFMA
jgi:DNA-3-methyladenine glycosylase II